MMHVYQRIKNYLIDNEIKVEDIAEKISCSVSELNAMLDGTETLYADDLREICYALNVSPEEFILITKEK